ncbi:MAG: hypothetical protein ACRCX2_28655 [Paraclostridium sp.]
MEISKAIEVIANDIVGTIVLIVEDEGNFSEEIMEFIELNHNIFIKSNNLTLSMDDIKDKYIENIIAEKLIKEGYEVQQNGSVISVSIK